MCIQIQIGVANLTVPVPHSIGVPAVHSMTVYIMMMERTTKPVRHPNQPTCFGFTIYKMNKTILDFTNNYMDCVLMRLSFIIRGGGHFDAGGAVTRKKFKRFSFILCVPFCKSLIRNWFLACSASLMELSVLFSRPSFIKRFPTSHGQSHITAPPSPPPT